MIFSMHSNREFARVNFPLFLHNKHEFKQIKDDFPCTRKLYMYPDSLSHDTSRNKSRKTVHTNDRDKKVFKNK